MEHITAAEFKERISKNPSYTQMLDALEMDLTIITFCDMGGSNIETLSPRIRFTGIDKGATGDCASFRGCKNLQNAAGTFHGYVDFSNSGVQTSKELVVTKNDCNGNAARFANCPNLEKAEGIFQGGVSWENSGIQSIDPKLTIQKGTKGRCTTSFWACKNLKVLTGKFPGLVIASDSGIEEIKNLELEMETPIGKDIGKVEIVLNITGTPLKRVPSKILENPTVCVMDTKTRTRLEHEKRARMTMKHKGQPMEL